MTSENADDPFSMPVIGEGRRRRTPSSPDEEAGASSGLGERGLSVPIYPPLSLSSAQWIFVEALLRTNDVTKAQVEAKVRKEDLSEWFGRQDFSNYVSARLQEVAVARGVTRSSLLAFGRDVMAGKTEPSRVAMYAWAKLLDMSLAIAAIEERAVRGAEEAAQSASRSPKASVFGAWNVTPREDPPVPPDPSPPGSSAYPPSTPPSHA